MKNELKIFVYGTLKKGFSNHDLYCSGVLRIEPARLRGRLFRLTPDIPVMVLPGSEILAIGSENPVSDAQMLRDIESVRIMPRAAGDTGFLPAEESEKTWKIIDGELHFFGDPESRLPLIDELEEFRPGEPSTYIRVLVRVELADGSLTTAWTYVAGFDTMGLESYDAANWFPDD
jgi:gamma-glutamylcyclotransferase (GGCT)/AIG2-like uncharacterized protein YtfP